MHVSSYFIIISTLDYIYGVEWTISLAPLAAAFRGTSSIPTHLASDWPHVHENDASLRKPLATCVKAMTKAGTTFFDGWYLSSILLEAGEDAH